ncbi:hypothetical protein CRG98_014080, partial [Punica granatum]
MEWDHECQKAFDSIKAYLIQPSILIPPAPNRPLILYLTNQFADALATLASMASVSEGNIIEPLEIEVAKGPAHCIAIEASEAKPWYEDIRNFLQTGQYPSFADRRDRKTLRRLAMHYFLSGEILYRRSFDSTLL